MVFDFWVLDPILISSTNFVNIFLYLSFQLSTSMREPSDKEVSTTEAEVQENMDKIDEVGTFTGDDVSWRPRDGSDGAEVMVVDEKVEVVKSEDVDFGDDDANLKDFEKAVETEPEVVDGA